MYLFCLELKKKTALYRRFAPEAPLPRRGKKIKLKKWGGGISSWIQLYTPLNKYLKKKQKRQKKTIYFTMFINLFNRLAQK